MSAWAEHKAGLITDSEYAYFCRQEEWEYEHPEEDEEDEDEYDIYFD